MAAWGSTAVGEVRPSAPHPTRSALLGLLAAALGLRRDDDERHEALGRMLRFAVRVDRPAQLLEDTTRLADEDPTDQRSPLAPRRWKVHDRSRHEVSRRNDAIDGGTGGCGPRPVAVDSSRARRAWPGQRPSVTRAPFLPQVCQWTRVDRRREQIALGGPRPPWHTRRAPGRAACQYYHATGQPIFGTIEARMCRRQSPGSAAARRSRITSAPGVGLRWEARARARGGHA